MNTTAKVMLGWGLALCAGLAHASQVAVGSPSSLEPGAPLSWAATLTFSKNAASVLKLTQSTVLPEGSKNTTSTVQAQFDTTKPYATTRVDMGLDQIIYDNTTGKISQYVVPGGFSLTLGASSDLQLDGGHLAFHDLGLVVAPDGQTSVYGNLTGQSLGGAQVAYRGLIWTGVADTGQVSFNGLYFRPFADVTLPQLAFTTAAFEAMAGAFGLNPDGLTYAAFQSTAGNFGRLTVSSVPEPGANALLAMGLFGVAVLARRQRCAPGQRLGVVAPSVHENPLA
jgi:hypothetical protein